METVVDDPEEVFQMLMKIGSRAGGLGEWHEFQVAERFQAVAESVDGVVHRKNFQFTAAGFGVKTKEESIDERQGLTPKVFGGDFIVSIVQFREIDA